MSHVTVSERESERKDVMRIARMPAGGTAARAAARGLGDDLARWRAVAARDARRDGAFVFAVRTTGIYCRPSCPARRPGPGNVVFFRAPEEAERAGFRPCRRCRPQEPAAADPEAPRVRDLCRYIESHLDRPLTLRDLGARTGLGSHRLRRAFRRVTGITPRQYADAARMRRVKERLRQGDDVSAATYEAGFGSSSRLYERAGDHLGMTPATYRKGGAGMRIGFTIVASPLGRLLVGVTGRGVCAVYLGDSDRKLEAALREEYPRAEIRRAADGLARRAGAVLGQLRGRPGRRDLPLDVQAAAFTRRVWEALRAIPRGETRTYTEIARALGRPRAARAMGSACARNPVSVLIPCHRVVRGDGGLGGYRWGLARKKALLRLERDAARRAP